MTNASKPSPHYAPERESRVADALRENLRKRKQQAQTRAAQNADTNNSKDS